MTLPLAAGLICMVALGAISQRVTGLGFALVVSPLFVLSLGPSQGILMVNALGAMSAALMLARHWRYVRSVQVLPILVGALGGVAVGIGITLLVSAALLALIVGGVVLVTVALLAVPRPRTSAKPGRRSSAVLAGALSGTLTAVAGVGGPPLLVYGTRSGWTHRQFATTMQSMAVVVGATSITGKLAFGTATFPDAPWYMWAGLLTAIPCGIWVGGLLAARMPAKALWIAIGRVRLSGGLSLRCDDQLSLV